MQVAGKGRRFRWVDSNKSIGVEARHSVDRDAKPTPKPVLYVVREGTDCLVKRTGNKQWRKFTTTQDCVFDSTYRTTDKSIIFFRVGFLLCVNRNFVETRECDEAGEVIGRPPRFGDAPPKQEEDLDSEYLSMFR